MTRANWTVPAVLAAMILICWEAPCLACDYPWLPSCDPDHALRRRITPPPGYERVDVPAGSFQDWLRHLPLKPGHPPVRLHDGRLKPNQGAHLAVVDIDTGARDLQQCADAVIRLRAEFLFARRQLDRIHFNFTSGERASFSRWMEGYRPGIRGNRVIWSQIAGSDRSHGALQSYLEVVFTYAGTASLARELRPVSDPQDLQVGDVFIQGGFPGHAVLVVDLVENRHAVKRAFALLQSYMPAQDMHVLRNPKAPESPWYDLEFGDTLETPEWTFHKSHLRRFP